MATKSRSWLGALVVLNVCGHVAAQSGAADRLQSQDQKLLQDLGDAEHSMAAIRTLTRRGQPAVALLTTAMQQPVFRASEERLANAVYILGQLGELAVPAIPVLMGELDQASGPLLRNLYWALGEIGPWAEHSDAVADQLQRHKPEPGWEHQEWAFACRRIEEGLQLQVDDVEHLLKQIEHAARIVAAAWLNRQPAGAAIPRQQLLATWRLACADWSVNGEGAKRQAQELSRAVARHCESSDPDAVAAARVVLVYHFDLEVRLLAVMKLGQSPGSDPQEALRALLDATRDPSILVRREAVTALGMLGAAAADAQPRLEELGEDPDLQTRGRAAAALRAIQRAK